MAAVRMGMWGMDSSVNLASRATCDPALQESNVTTQWKAIPVGLALQDIQVMERGVNPLGAVPVTRVHKEYDVTTFPSTHTTDVGCALKE